MFTHQISRVAQTVNVALSCAQRRRRGRFLLLHEDCLASVSISEALSVAGHGHARLRRLEHDHDRRLPRGDEVHRR